MVRRKDTHMANMQDVNKVIITAVVNRDTRRRLQKVAEATGRTLSATASSVLRDALEDVELTPEDLRKIAEEIEEAKAKRRRS